MPNATLDLASATPLEETPDLVFPVGSVQAEEAARIAADDAEAATRATADTAEAAARVAGDSAVATSVSTEATTRAAAVTAEATTRAAADTAEATLRANADTAEATARIAADVIVAGAAVTNTGGGKEIVSTVAASGAARTLDLAGANVFDVTLTANCTFTFTGATNGRSCGFTLWSHQDGTGARAVTWPAAVKWPSGAAPTLTTTAGATSVLSFVTLDGGTTWYGFLAGDNLS